MYWGNNSKPRIGPFEAWILEHKDELLAGSADYYGTEVTDSTEFYQFEWVLSLGVITLQFKSAPDIPSSYNGFLRRAMCGYSALSFFFGWWGFPFGPPLTIGALWHNLGRGKSRTIGSYLQYIETGFDAPPDVSIRAHRRNVLTITDRAAAEIFRRRKDGNFAEDCGIRFAPADAAGREVTIQFDFPVTDGRDWVQETPGMLVLIDKRHEPDLTGAVIDFVDGRFVSDFRRTTQRSN
jgi:Fe-S cluster assembly iron-binding protein IscA